MDVASKFCAVFDHVSESWHIAIVKDGFTNTIHKYIIDKNRSLSLLGSFDFDEAIENLQLVFSNGLLVLVYNDIYSNLYYVKYNSDNETSIKISNTLRGNDFQVMPYI